MELSQVDEQPGLKATSVGAERSGELTFQSPIEDVNSADRVSYVDSKYHNSTHQAPLQLAALWTSLSTPFEPS
jgi:hypothetical protein